MTQQLEHDVIIIGAGAAGLAAAQKLKAAGREPLILEARDRLGGRIWTDHTITPVELGAEFIHGEHAATWQLIEPAALETDLWPRGRQYQQYTYLYILNGHLLADSALDTQMAALYEHVTHFTGPECSAREAVLAITDPDDAALPYILSRLACVEAAEVDRLSATALTQERALNTAGWENYHIRAGYDALPALMAQGLDIRCNSPVTRIDWSDSGAQLLLANNQTLTARHVIVTVPLGVLQADCPNFLPALPPAKQQAIAVLAMGHVTKLVLQFSRSVWPSFSYLCSDGVIPDWWQAGSADAPVLMGYSGGPAALELAALGEEAAIEQGLAELSQAFGDDIRSAFVSGRLVDWSTDPWSLGAYTYTPVGAGNARAELAAPLASTLFFAGEATSTNGHVATVHGAIETGWRAAAEVLAVV
ncbi:MAG: FAD-dependent oxidoreductase [Anaerolineae bacterium]|nr:FAD-dependent oxidoreductase [Anaerolineae bacterium]